MCEVNFGKTLSPRQGCEKIVRFGQGVPVNLEDRVNCNLVVPTKPNFTIPFWNWHHWGCPLTVRDLFNNAQGFQPIQFLLNSLLQGKRHWPSFNKLWSRPRLEVKASFKGTHLS